MPESDYSDESSDEDFDKVVAKTLKKLDESFYNTETLSKDDENNMEIDNEINVANDEMDSNSNIQNEESEHGEGEVPFSDRNLDESMRQYCPINTKIYIKRYITPTPSMKRKYYKVHACAYCGKIVSDIQTHYFNKHSHKEEVKAVYQARKLMLEEKEKLAETDNKFAEFKKSFVHKQETIRLLGDHIHNKVVMERNEGELLVQRRSKDIFKSTNYMACPSCYEWFLLSRHIYKHKETCPDELEGKPKDLVLASKIISSHVNIVNDSIVSSEQLKSEVFPSMASDNITAVAQQDSLIVAC